MGGCGSKPKDLDVFEAPVETPAADVPAVAEAETAPEEKKEEVAEEPLVDLSVPAVEETKEEAVPVEEEKKA